MLYILQNNLHSQNKIKELKLVQLNKHFSTLNDLTTAYTCHLQEIYI
jgi:hypothetical protein